MHTRDHRQTRACAALAALLWGLCHSSQPFAAALASGPATIAAGPVAITPTLGTEIQYRDNIYLQENNKTDSWIALLRPEINARM